MTLFQILQEEGQVEFKSGYILRGNKDLELIECYTSLAGEIHSDGFQPLTKPGTAKAIAEAREHQRRTNEEF